MHTDLATRSILGACLTVLLVAAALAEGTASNQPFEPFAGQPGKDVVWVPTPQHTVEKALDVAQVTPADYVIDLGSGDGRMVIAAAKRGVPGHGVEYNPRMVELSNRLAREAGVADKARFIQGDMYEADISRATVLPLFLLSENLSKLVPNFLRLAPGTRIVTVSFEIEEWEADARIDIDDCKTWCTIFKYTVPAQIEGKWRLHEADLVIEQSTHQFTGRLEGAPISDGRIRGRDVTFSIGGTTYSGRVTGAEMRGEMTGARTGTWTAGRS